MGCLPHQQLTQASPDTTHVPAPGTPTPTTPSHLERVGVAALHVKQVAHGRQPVAVVPQQVRAGGRGAIPLCTGREARSVRTQAWSTPVSNPTCETEGTLGD